MGDDVFFDRILPAAGLVIVSLLVLMLTIRLTRGWSRKRMARLGFSSLIAIIAFAVFLFDSAAMLRVLPFRNAIFINNWLMPLAAVLGAVAWRSMKIPAWRRSIVVGGILAMAGIITFRPLIARKPEVREKWKHGLCMQTTWATCNAASAVNLLKLYGLDSTEAEMARLALTTRRGTMFHGSFRGLSLRTEGTPLKVQAFNGSFEELQQIGRPILVRVGVRRFQKVDERYEKEWGWLPGVAHSVVLLGFKDGRVEVADPSTGKETWDLDVLRTLWHGIGLTLVER